MRPEVAMEEARSWAQIERQEFYRQLVDMDGADEHGRSLLEYLVSTASFVAQTPDDHAFRNYYHLILSLGCGPRHAPLVLPDWMDPMQLRNCYENAALMAMEFEELTYVEGYAWHSFVPMQHAWLEHEDGTIIDPTWAQGELTQYGDHATYMGVKFDIQLLRTLVVKHGIYGLFTGDSEARYPMLRNGLVMNGDVAIALREEIA